MGTGRGDLMDFIKPIEQYLAEHPALIGAVSTPLAIWLGGKLLALVISLFNLRRVHQIVSADDPALDEVETIQRIKFPIEERDPEGLLARKIAASDFDPMKRPRGDEAMIVLYYKRGRNVIAYLTAEYFKETRTIFFWYIALRDEHKDGAAEEGGSAAVPMDPGDVRAALKMVKKLLTICDRIGGTWEHVIAEVDSRDMIEAVFRLRRFQQYAWLLRYSNYDDPMRWPAQVWRWLRGGTGKQPPSVFKVEIPFRMPLHEAGLTFEAEKHETPAWLVVAPRDNEAVRKLGPDRVMPRDEVVTLLHALRNSYSDPDEPQYNAYITGFYDKLVSTVPEQSRLISRLSSVEGVRVSPRGRRSVLRPPRPA